MKPKRSTLLCVVFAVGAVAAGLLMPVREATAEIAVCTDGVCTMKESDYRMLQKFHARVRDVAEQSDQQTMQMANDIEQLNGALARCRSQLSKRPV
jgi:glutamate mutase epsilon subunit